MDDEAEGRIDGEWIARVQAGDEVAARQLFDVYMPTLRARVRRKLPAAVRRKVAESDVIQEAYLAAFLSLGDFEDRGEASFKRWLGKILEHKILDEVRRYFGTRKRDARREQSTTGSSPDMGKPASDPSPSMHAMAAEERAAMWQAVDGLAQDYRTILRLVHQEGLNLTEAGARMGRSPDAARKLYGRAVAKLTDGLHEGDGEGNPKG